jgi:hypothetical protein
MSARLRRIAVAIAALAVSASLGVATVSSGGAHTVRNVAGDSWCC